MKLVIVESEHEKVAPIGTILSVEQAAQLMEMNAADVAEKTRNEEQIYANGILLEPL